MPIYEYACQSCGHAFDALQKMSDEPLTDCPDCGEPQLKKLLSAPNFRLKGGGWYETDFKSENRRNIAEGSGDGAAKEDKKDTKKEETKKADGAKADKPAKSSGDSKSTGATSSN